MAFKPEVVVILLLEKSSKLVPTN